MFPLKVTQVVAIRNFAMTTMIMIKQKQNSSTIAIEESQDTSNSLPTVTQIIEVKCIDLGTYVKIWSPTLLHTRKGTKLNE